MIMIGVQSGSTHHSAGIPRARKVRAHSSDASGAARRLDLNKDEVNVVDAVVGPTTRLQWCQQWLKTDNVKETSVVVSFRYLCSSLEVFLTFEE